MGMNTRVQGRLPLLQCITFHSLLVFEEIAVQKIYLAKYQKSKTRENSRVHTGYGRHKFNPSGPFYESIEPSTKQKKYEFKSRVSKSKQMIQFTEGIMYQGKTHKILHVKDTVG